jgi:DNA-binding MarR family transcriptional regulator
MLSYWGLFASIGSAPRRAAVIPPTLGAPNQAGSIVEPMRGSREHPTSRAGVHWARSRRPKRPIQSLFLSSRDPSRRMDPSETVDSRTSTSPSDVDRGIHSGVKDSPRSVSRDDVAEGLEQAAILIVRHLSVRAGLGLTASMALGTLNREGPARVTALAAAGGIGQPAMTELVQRLQRQGLVTRVDDPADGRAALVTITNSGRVLLDEQRRDRHDRLAEMLAALPAEDEATLTLTMRVALPIIGRLIHNATNPALAPTPAP